MIWKSLLTGIVIAFIAQTGEGSSRLESAIEQKCFEVKNKVPVDMNFLASFKTMYYPIMSRYDLYHTSFDLLGDDFEEWSEGSLYYDNCMTWKMFNGTAISTGFNGRTREYKIRASPSFDEFEFWTSEGKGYNAKGWTTLTDNATYLFTPVCTHDGVMAYGVGTNTPTLPKETIKKLRDHAESLGFKKKYFTELRYDMCNLESDADNEISDGKSASKSADKSEL